ncbi:MFS transporter [uncultured Corynebacterium sp.]|uniref:MFS transporter n=1 Tax=uncultured Corynebacterium sp. TaxID=159447 RepID=UPI0025D7A7EA|nr:MFS transporter [uncultured Corynebacterium sp.]
MGKLSIRQVPFYLIIFIDNLSVSLVLPVLIPITYDQHAGLLPHADSVQQNMVYGLAIGLYSIAMFFGSPWLGALSDLLRRGRTLIICLLGLILGYLVTAWAILEKNLFLFLLGRVICGLSSGSLPVAQAAIMDVTPRERRVAALSQIMFWVSVGYVAGPLIGGYLSDSTVVSWFNLTTPFLVVAGTSLLNLAILLVSYREPADEGSLPFSRPKPFSRLIEAFRTPGIRLLSLVLLLLSLGWTAYFQFIGLYLSAQKDYSQQMVGNLIAVLGVGLAGAFLFFVPLLAQKLRSRQTIPTALLILALCLGVTPLIDHRWLLTAVGLVSAIGYGTSYSSLIGLMSVSADDEHQGSVMGMAAAIAAVTAGTSGVFFGFVSGSSPVPILSASVLTIFAFLLSLRINGDGYNT